jgi:hypothetical protein
MGDEEKPVRLTDLEPKIGEARELPAHDRARLTIAVNVLGAVALIVLMACLLLVFGPADRIQEERLIFDFVKTIAPPIVTLVIGFYFRNESA